MGGSPLDVWPAIDTLCITLNQIDTNMTKSVAVITRVSPELKAKIEALARQTQRSEAFIAREALASFVDANAWQVATIAKRLGELQAGAETVPHDEVERWIDSKGTANEKPMPGRRR